MFKLLVLFTGLLLMPILVYCQNNTDSIEKFSVHFQFTGISQSHAAFHARYSGDNSLDNTVERSKLSVTSTLFTGLKLGKNTEVYSDAEIAGGTGLSSAKGIAGFTNGETFRIGSTAPVAYLARYYIKQIIPFKSNSTEYKDADQHQLAGFQSEKRVEIVLGKVCLSDFFDLNNYSHDPRTQFMNWSLMSNGGWDYPADTRGYTKAIIATWYQPMWELRVSSAMVPAKANGLKLDTKISKAHSETIEYTQYLTKDKKTILRILAFRTRSQAPTYQYAIQEAVGGDSIPSQVIGGLVEWKRYGGIKYGLGGNFETTLTKSIGLFARASWNDGKSATWAFTEIDNSCSVGVLVKGTKWHRNEDKWGIAAVSNGISEDHKTYLAKGNYGFIVGDGQLNYQREFILETYYSVQINSFLAASANFQLVKNPAYNSDRGPVNVWAVRAHVAL